MWRLKMINQYRKKFILTTMLSLLIVLVIIIGSINFFNYQKTKANCDFILEQITSQDGPFNNPDGPNPGNRDVPMGPEFRFQTRYFEVTLDASGEVVNTKLDFIASVSEQEATDYAKAVAKKNSTKGYYQDYRYKVTADGDQKTYTFLESSRELSTNRTFLLISTIISLIGFIVVFVLITILSKLVVKPFYQNMEKQKKFITDASHELKTPLTIINADVDVIELDSGANTWTESIRKQTARLANMTKKLTLMAKMDEETHEFDMGDVKIGELLNQAVSDFSTVFNNSDKEIHLENNIDLSLHANEELINELFFIMLDNANKYSTGDIYIKSNVEHSHLVLEFSNPAEVPDGNLDYLFDRFYRLDEAHNSKTGGSGIGLSMAKSIMDIHHGKISAKGSNKTIYFTITFKI